METHVTFETWILQVLHHVPNFPKADRLYGDLEIVTLIYKDFTPAQLQEVLDKAAADDEVLCRLAHLDHGTDTIEVAKQKWQEWLRKGLYKKGTR